MDQGIFRPHAVNSLLGRDATNFHLHLLRDDEVPADVKEDAEHENDALASGLCLVVYSLPVKGGIKKLHDDTP